MRKQQLLLIAGGLAIVLLLYFFGRTTRTSEKPVAHQGVTADFSDYEALQLQMLPEGDAETIRSLKSAATVAPSPEAYIELSRAWEDRGNFPLGAFYYYEAAKLGEDHLAWVTAGDKLFNGYKNYSDTLITNNLINFALASYERAVKFDNGNVPLRMKLAEAYVESPEPMKGILMLREIADSIPEYIPAQMRLGRLSLQTGQFEKAEMRFQSVLEISPVNTEAMYFLALTNEGLGRIDETIRLLELCRDLVDRPEFTNEVNAYIDDLKNKKE